MQLSFAFFVCKQYINIRAFVQHNIIYYRVFFLYTSSIGPFSVCNCLLHTDREGINKKASKFYLTPSFVTDICVFDTPAFREQKKML